jgi:hypothetical protein
MPAFSSRLRSRIAPSDLEPGISRQRRSGISRRRSCDPSLNLDICRHQFEAFKTLFVLESIACPVSFASWAIPWMVLAHDDRISSVRSEAAIEILLIENSLD